MKYYLIAGEASGDLHGSNLLKGLIASDPDALFRFRGGDLMREAAGERGVLVKHFRDGAVMGVGDVLRKAGTLLSDIRRCEEDILRWEPDALILIDYPGFNLRVAEDIHGKSRRPRILYYIAPKTWASRERRNEKIKRFVDRLFIVFPFEKQYFDSVGVPYTYAGNPLIDAVDSHVFTRPCDGEYVALLPGSRKGEIARMMPVCLEALRGVKVVVAAAPGIEPGFYDRFLYGRTDVQVLSGRTYDILKYSRAAVVNSGTASLEAALIGTPQVVAWSTDNITAWVAGKVLRVMDHIRYISLGNLILGREAFRELVQDEFTVSNLRAETDRLLTDDVVRGRMLSDYSDIRESLGGAGASVSVARAMTNFLLSTIQ